MPVGLLSGSMDKVGPSIHHGLVPVIQLVSHTIDRKTMTKIDDVENCDYHNHFLKWQIRCRAENKEISDLIVASLLFQEIQQFH